jgi:hypothetical protein
MLVRILFVLSLTASAWTQSRDTASLFGSVYDAQSAPIPGAIVTLTVVDTGQARMAATDESGRYTFSLLPVGGYKLTIEKPAFRRYARSGIVLEANQNAKVDVTMEVGDVKTTVSVNAAATQVELQVATIKEIVDRARVVDLPLNGRDASQLALLVPGVVSGGTSTVSGNIVGENSFSINGSRNNNVRFTLDGGSHMDNHYNQNIPFRFPDAVEEFSVQTSNMGPDHGASSAGAINIVTKSGTNRIHGDVFEFLRNSNLNATNFFSHNPDRLRRNQTGFTVGGPILRNRLFAFGGFQQTWIRTTPGSTRYQNLNAAEWGGNFSGDPTMIRDPATGQPFPGNRIPQPQLSPAALKFMTANPLPGANGFVNYSNPTPEDGRQYVGRVDYTINRSHTLTARGFSNSQTDPFHSSPDNLSAALRSSKTPASSWTLAENFTVSPNMIAHTQFAATYLKEQGQTDYPYNYNHFGVGTFAPANDISIGLSNTGVGFNSPWPRNFHRASEEVSQDWTWTHGAHTLSWGAQFEWSQYNEATLYQVSGAFTFNGQYTGFDRADFLLGQFSNFQQNSGEYENRRVFLQGYYAGDVWRVSRRLTLNLGLRWQPYTFMSDTENRNQTFDMGNYLGGVHSQIFPLAPAGLLYNGDKSPAGYPCGPKIPLQVTCPANQNWGPRVGLAWDPFGDGKTSLRTGYGIFYDVPLTREQNNSNDVAPFNWATQFPSGQLDSPYLGRQDQNKFPILIFTPNLPFPNPLTMYVLDSKWKVASAQNWNLTLERQLLADTRLRVAYVGTKGTHLAGYYDQNSPIYNPKLTLAQNIANVNDRRPLVGFARILRNMNGLNSDYNGLQISVEKRFHRGFSVLSSFTWSKTLDYFSVDQAVGGYSASPPFNFFYGRGPADQNLPRHWVTSFVWELPGASVSSPAARLLTEHWRLSGILTFQSGTPFNVSAVNNPLAGISYTVYANMNCGANPVLGGGRSKGAEIAQYFNTSCFTNPAADSVGTLGRNSMTGPGFANVDVSLAKGIRIPFLGEAGSVQLRGEAFNLLNRTNFNNPVTGLTNPLFGQLTGAGAPRILQIATKVVF